MQKASSQQGIEQQTCARINCDKPCRDGYGFCSRTCGQFVAYTQHLERFTTQKAADMCLHPKCSRKAIGLLSSGGGSVAFCSNMCKESWSSGYEKLIQFLKSPADGKSVSVG